MYKPPENCNRVKSIKSKFENIENKTASTPKVIKNKTEVATSLSNPSKKYLSRQFSDPAKKNNIKRTPAFRLDKTPNFPPKSSQNYFESKVKQFNSASKLNNCDNNENIIENSTKIQKPIQESVIQKPVIRKPLIQKSKSSLDFASIRGRFDESNVENQRNVTKDLYTEPIPKSLRNKIDNCDKILYSNANENSDDDFCKSKTLKVSDVVSALNLTDTLKNALRKPLPAGPPPRKPPRTFRHSPKSADRSPKITDRTPKITDRTLKPSDFSPTPEKNSSFLHLKQTDSSVKKPTRIKIKNDPNYMLNKLETALRNNKLRLRKTAKNVASSGEDSDDSLKFRKLPAKPIISNNSLNNNKTNNNNNNFHNEDNDDDDSSELSNSFNFNCLNGLTCSSSTYERIKEPNSSFFVSCAGVEPVYAEPFHFFPNYSGEKTAKQKNIRNNLYYMSTPVLCGDKKMDEKSAEIKIHDESNKVQNETKCNDFSKKMSTSENSSLVSSDLDSSAVSTPLDESKIFDPNATKIKHLIETFESKSDQNCVATNKNTDNPSHRIDDLKLSLQKTIDKCFSTCLTPSPLCPPQFDQQVDFDGIVNKFETYVKKNPKYEKPTINRDSYLFYCILIVEWNEEAQIKLKFPKNVAVPQRIEDLCYPEAASGPLDRSNNAQCYSLVITNDKGERTFGYCRRVIPEGSRKCLPLTYCILSKHRAPRFYKKILTELESRHGIPDKLRDELISEFYYKKFPQPGESIKINLTNIIEHSNNVLDLNSYVYVDKNTGYGTLNNHKRVENEKSAGKSPKLINHETELVLTLHHDTRYEDADLQPIHKLQPGVLLKIFASLLLERKVILISCVISKLSGCVDCLQSILYPFSWPHTFIPILPQCLWDVVESPTPVICGVLSVAVVNKFKIEHGIVVDLDEGNVLIEEGDEDKILSGSMQKTWMKSLELANTVAKENYVHSVHLSDAYLRVFTTCLGNYKNFIVDGKFQKETFIRNGKTKGIRRFLKWFTETAMFLSFIESVINDPDSFLLFDKKIEMFGSDESNLILDKLLEWNKR